MKDWRYHRLAKIHLSPLLSFELPDDWSHGREESGRFWCGREDEPGTLFIQGFAQQGSLEERVAELAAFLAEAPGLVSEVLAIRQDGGLALTATVDHEEDGVPYRTFRWYVFKPSGEDVVLQMRFILSTAVDRAETPKTRELIEIVAAQARADLFHVQEAERLPQLVERWAAQPPSEREDCRLDFRRIRIAEAFGFIRVPAPMAWTDDRWDPEAEMWGLSGEPALDARLWVDYDVNPVELESDDRLRRVLLDVVGPRGRLPAKVRFDCSHEDGGWIVATFHEEQEHGERRRYWRWNVAKRRQGGLCVLYIVLEVGPTVGETPDETLLVQLYDEAAPISEIGEPPPQRIPPGAMRPRR